MVVCVPTKQANKVRPTNPRPMHPTKQALFVRATASVVSWRHPPNHSAGAGIFPGNNEQLTTPDPALALSANSRERPLARVGGSGSGSARSARQIKSAPRSRPTGYRTVPRLPRALIHLLSCSSHKPRSRSRTAHLMLAS